MKYLIGWWIVNKPKNHIDRLDVPVRINNALRLAGIVTIEHLIQYLTTGKTPRGANSIRNFGAKSETICREALRDKGFLKRCPPDAPEYIRLPDDQWKLVLDYWRNQCAVCEKPPTEFSPLQQDHWIPRTSLAFTGSGIGNIIPLCWGCNVEKSDQGPYLWMVAKFGQPQANDIMRLVLDYFDWCQDNYD